MIIDRMLKIKLFCIIIISNLMVLLICSIMEPNACEAPATPEIDPSMTQIRIQAQLLTSFDPGKKISILNSKRELLAHGNLIDQEEGQELTYYLVGVDVQSLSQFSPNETYYLYPQITEDLSGHSQEEYEVHY